MAYDGTLKFDTSMDSSGFQQGTNKLTDIVKGLGVFKLLEKGFELVTSSIDRAVSRYDTLNKFPQVLENMGFSAEASAAATKKLSDGVQGLPTSLDEIVASAQQLTVLTGNLEDSTDTALALNNAFLASGSGAADASRGMVQYTQMLTKGKVDIVSWRTLQETMGYALQKTAEAFGFAGQSAQNDLYAALKDGDITFTEFNAKLVELDQAVGGFADMAKTSTGGIATAFTNMKTRIAAGVAEVISALDRGFAQTRFKSIENIISSTGTVVKNALSNMAGAFEFVAANSETLIPLLVSIGAAVTAWKIGAILLPIVQGFQMAAVQVSLYAAASTAAQMSDAAHLAVLSLKEVVMGVVAGKIGLVTAAQWLWNAAMLANPIGLVIAGIALLVAAIIGLVMWLGNNNEAYKEGKQYIEDYGAANEELADSFDESTGAFKDNQNAAEANANTSRSMLAGLRDLAGEGLNRTAEETYQLQAKINALNTAQQGLGLTINETTGELSMSQEEIEAYIAATESAAKATALEDHMKALNQQLVDIETQFVAAESQVALWDAQLARGEITQQQYNKLTKDLGNEVEALGVTHAAVLEEMGINEEAYSQLLVQQEQERQALIALQEDEIRQFAAQHHLSFDEIMADMDENNLSFAEWQDENAKTLDKSQEEIADFASKWGYSLEEVNAAITASGLTVEEYVQRQDDALEHAKEVVADYTATTTNGFSTMDQQTAISLDNFMANMQKNQEATANWADNMNTLMDLGINQGVIEQLAQMGPEGAAQAQAFVDELTQMNGGVDLALGETNEAVATKLAEIDATFDTSLETASAAADAQLRAESYYEAGYASIDQIATGIAENPSAVDAATQAGTDISQGITTAVESVDFSSTGQNIGNSLVSGLTSAIQSGSGQITSAVTNMSTSVQNTFKTMSTQSQSTVTQMMTSINSTIVSKTSAIKSSITSMGNSITTALNTAKTQAVNITTQMMTSINSAIVSRTSTIKSSMTACANGVVTAVTDMKTKSVSQAEQMMTGINSAVVTRTSTVKSSATAVANGIVEGLKSMIAGAETAANNMMDGIGRAMDNKAQSLYAKARSIADKIAATLRDAWDEHSPSRVSYKIMEFFMQAMYNAMGDMSGLLYRKADGIADDLTDRLTISPEALVEQLRALTEVNQLGGTTLVPLAAGASAVGGVNYSTNLTQNITTPKPLSASEMTREGQDLLRRQRWQLP